MDLKFQIGRSISHIVNFCFIIVYIFGQTSLILVSSEDISSIPLSLYQTELLDTSNALDSLDRKSGDSYKRGSSKAFYGLRGKKLSEPFEDGVETEKRKSSFYPVRGKKKPAAFTALRGKKVYNLEVLNNNDYSNGEIDHSFQNGEGSTPYPSFNSLKGDDYNWRATKTNGSPSLDSLIETRDKSPYNQLQMSNEDSQIYDGHSTDKRRSVFVPMRGRKSDETEVDEKRGTSFFPMRGKKMIGDEDEINALMDKRLSSGFFPMRGRKSYLDALKQSPENNRRSTFIPMRGRKSQMSKEWQEDSKDTDFQKKSLGFLPMRGRRSSLSEYGVDDTYYQPNAVDILSRLSSSEDKRATFHALRGKKKNPRSADWDYPKRAFYALRGKRSDDYNKDEKSSAHAPDNDLNSVAVDVLTSSKGGKPRVKRNPLKQMDRGTSRTAPENDR